MIDSHPFQVLPLADHNTLPVEVVVWSQEEYDILQTLSIRVRLMSMQQVSQIWEDRLGKRRLHRSVGQLVQAKLVRRFTINTHPALKPTVPLISWKPDSPPPDFRDISDRARGRWDQPCLPTEVIVASKQTANLFGSNAHGLPPLEHRDHDLLLCDAYVAYRQQRAAESVHWVSEEFLPKAGFQIKDPDAFLIDSDGHPTRVIESAGRYSATQCESFHDHCESLALPYELW